MADSFSQIYIHAITSTTVVKNYIANQEYHHQHRSYEVERATLLQLHEIEDQDINSESFECDDE